MDVFLEVVSTNVAVPKKIAITKDVVIFGRQKDCDVFLDDKTVSRQHAKIVKEKDTWVLEDMQSGNGTFLNGKKVSAKRSLKSGDTLKIGSTVFVFNTGVSAETLAAPVKAAHPKGIDKRVVAALAVCCGLIVLFFMTVSQTKEGPAIQSVDQQYTILERQCAFNHPEGWERLDKFFEDIVSTTYYDHFALFFGPAKNSRGEFFAVDVVTNVPPSFGLSDIVSFNADTLPRIFSHTGEISDYLDMQIDGRDAIVVESAPFDKGGKVLRSIEAFVLVGDRRYLFIGFAPEGVFEQLRPLFVDMITSVTIRYEPQKFDMTQEQALQQAQEIISKADVWVEKKALDPANLYHGVREYIRALTLLNAYFPIDYSLTQACLEKLRTAQQMFDGTYKEYRFNLDKAVKLGNVEEIYENAKKILLIIPDKKDERYKDAQWYYERYKDMFEKRREYK